MCQLFVHWELTPVRAKLSQTIIYHYMDDILFCQRDPFQDEDLTFITTQLAAKGLVVAPEKIQKQAPWKYLGWILTSSSVHLQKLELTTQINTLNDAQKLIGDLQWVRSIAGIRNDEIAPLMSLLKGTDPQAPITLSADQKNCLIYLGKKLLSTLADRRLPDVPLGLLICNHSVAPCAIIFQWPAWQKEKGGEGPPKSRRGAKQPAKKPMLVQLARKSAEPLAILEWIFTPYTPPMSIWQRTEAIAYLIKKARTRIMEISGAEPEHISLPITIENLEWMLRHSEPIQLALLNYPGTVHNKQPSDPRLQIVLKQRWLLQPKVVKQPVKGLTVYTDAGSRQRKAACTWQEDSSWRSKVIDGDAHDSLQTLELTAVAWALSHWRDSKLNIVSDSLYVVGVVQRIEDALIKPPDNKRLCQLFFQIKRAIEDRNEPCCIIHIRSHQTEFGLGEGNARADMLWIKAQVFTVTVDNAFDLEVWLSIGDRLWSELTEGDTSVCSLAATWGALFKALEQSQSEDSEAEMEDLDARSASLVQDERLGDETMDEWRSTSSDRPGSSEDFGRRQRQPARQNPPPPGPALRALPPNPPPPGPALRALPPAAAGSSPAPPLSSAGPVPGSAPPLPGARCGCSAAMAVEGFPAPPLPSAGPVPESAPPLPRSRCGCSAAVPALISERQSAPPEAASSSTSSDARNDLAAGPPWDHLRPSPPCPVTAHPKHRGHFWDVSCVPRTVDRTRGDGGFGSTGLPQVFWSACISTQRPQMTCTLSLPTASPPQIQLRGLIDTGADVTIISFSAWPPSWPLTPMGSAIEGLGVPTINNAEPVQRYQWKVLPQGCKNSPTICQWYVAQALSGVREQFPEAYCYHYMDDILVAGSTQDELLRIQPQLFGALRSHGLQVAPEKVRQHPPWKYLGVKILDRTICYQEVQFVDSIKTLNDAQKLMGIITWLRPYLGLTTAQLSPLFNLLKGDPDLNSPRELTPEAQQALEDVQQAVSARQVYRVDPSIYITVFITCPESHPTGIIGQWSEQWSDPLHILEWIFLPHQPKKTAPTVFELVAQLIIKCCQRCLQLMAADPGKIILPIGREEFEWSLTNSASLQSALQNFSGQVAYHLPSHKLLQLAGSAELSFRQKSSRVPVQGPTIFTDSSGRTGKAIVTWKDESEWQVLEGHESGSAQLVELRAATMAFQQFSQVPLNLVTDSAYVADLAKRLDCVLLKEVDNEHLFRLLKSLWCVIQARVHPYYILHIRSRTNLPGFIAEGNARADRLANPAWVAPQPDKIAQAKASHDFFHQSAHTLQKQFHLTPTEARDIVSSCADCHGLAAPLPAGVNPRGLKALQLWQTDVTHIAEFGRLKYVHVSVDTFSSAMWASAHTGEKGRDVIAHWKIAFAVLGIPSSVKTDNDPAYASQKTRRFLQLWGVSHVFSIPHSPTGQAIVEHAHGTLKRVLEKQKTGMVGETPHSRLEKALYTITSQCKRIRITLSF
ncbi:uncharacterized protein LOC131592124 [Poecile atricapillus]|uniref:uncharacterized protein LOC131592124 n=1 Tax=Poecile atricapillus TaxID=48891 RepID=UPI00273909F2|nr:uncharacterized protein LOC131592124 [Poecile atricapillus]